MRSTPHWMKTASRRIRAGKIRDTLAAAIETLRQSARVWNADLIAHAGVVIAIAHDGEAYATLGVVRQL
jgi:hypothetical protein